MAEKAQSSGLYIVLISIHGLVRGHEMELGRDADTGGQVLYVVELARALAAHPDVWRVDLLTRQVADPKVSDDYARPSEQIADGAHIVRIPFGPRRYLRKEVLWPYLDSFVDSALQHVRSVGRVPDIVHGHYADAGLVGSKLASLLGAPIVFTGHSLGHEKRRRLLEHGMKPETIENRYNMSQRIEAEERALANASLVIASTHQEASDQYARYDNYRKSRIAVIPPGVDLERFRPPRAGDPRPPIKAEVERFLKNDKKPWILAMSRADERKNIRTLVDAYGESPPLQEKANLVIVAGTRDDINAMEKGPRRVLTDLLLRIDRYDLYGKVAYPKHHESDDVPALYRAAARSRGVFVNPALTEPFGLTLLEAAASGLPVVATNDGGPRDILARCKSGLLVDPLDVEGIQDALLDALTERQRWRRWSRSGLRAAKQEYSWETHVEKYLRALRRIVERPRRPARRVNMVKTRLPTADRLLVCDLDDTLLGDEEAVHELVTFWREHRNRVVFGVATGRRLSSTVTVLDEHGIPRPDIFITSVGTEIHYGPNPLEEERWREHVDYYWDAQAIHGVAAELPGVSRQPQSEQRRFKVSYYVDDRQALPSAQEIQRRLRRKRIHANVIYSHERNLDFLPIRASKGLAVRYIAYRWGLPMERVLTAGDSGNDEDMLTGNSLGVVVGNFSEELGKLRNRSRIYFAEAWYARGILEGIEHYDFFGRIREAHEPDGSRQEVEEEAVTDHEAT
ncbi:MAG: HAD-IIB family hydrolase [Gammaproteobacteria bacterium]|nr:HAD-IIB family hydrolase [Gammaproteobacteria bacterium]NIR85718.1 HAD-IIB family hydrolase [Gammaproteobacteria bacterium]NIR90251.1 HAD-IIB family hydrolase [Gammaproteobacteria bacterium]NIU06852.1 HAD-IIB family hydrolase [Gammaproteobacteria bacterium]NIV53785.1 HAD-IIB family hydrolase [Gammaproteobacteria bacterium]